jgi:hypothetical protein
MALQHAAVDVWSAHQYDDNTCFFPSAGVTPATGGDAGAGASTEADADAGKTNGVGAQRGVACAKPTDVVRVLEASARQAGAMLFIGEYGGPK